MKLNRVKKEDKEMLIVKKDMQNAFQRGFEDVYGKEECILPDENKCGKEEYVLPLEDIDKSLNEKGAIAYMAVENGDIVGGAIVVIDEITRHNNLHFLYVKYENQSRGIGSEIWKQIELMHPETKIWETCTPCFEKRNIFFYVEKCGFKIIDILKDNAECEEESGMVVFQKKM